MKSVRPVAASLGVWGGVGNRPRGAGAGPLTWGARSHGWKRLQSPNANLHVDTRARRTLTAPRPFPRPPPHLRLALHPPGTPPRCRAPPPRVGVCLTPCVPASVSAPRHQTRGADTRTRWGAGRAAAGAPGPRRPTARGPSGCAAGREGGEGGAEGAPGPRAARGPARPTWLALWNCFFSPATDIVPLAVGPPAETQPTGGTTQATGTRAPPTPRAPQRALPAPPPPPSRQLRARPCGRLSPSRARAARILHGNRTLPAPPACARPLPACGPSRTSPAARAAASASEWARARLERPRRLQRRLGSGRWPSCLRKCD